MKPFDLEAAKLGDVVLDGVESSPCHFIGVTQAGDVIIEHKNILHRRQQSDLRMAPKKRTLWLNFYEDGQVNYFSTKADANRHKTIRKKQRLFDKAYPLEVEE